MFEDKHNSKVSSEKVVTRVWIIVYNGVIWSYIMAKKVGWQEFKKKLRELQMNLVGTGFCSAFEIGKT